MANSLYDKGRQKFLEGSISWNGDSIRCVLVDAQNYAVDVATHEFLSDIAENARVSTSAALSGKTTTAGVANVNPVTFTTVTGAVSEAIVIYKDTGAAATSPLIAYLDAATCLPVTPNGSDIIVNWSTGSVKIFKL
jgi:hypothetical protein